MPVFIRLRLANIGRCQDAASILRNPDPMVRERGFLTIARQALRTAAIAVGSVIVVICPPRLLCCRSTRNSGCRLCVGARLARWLADTAFRESENQR